jgi:hypothetical protein
MLSAILIATIAFVCVFGGALIGIWLGIVVPKQYLKDESKEVVRVATAMIATLAALVLGLLVASAKGSYDTKENAFKQLVSRVILLDRTMAHYGLETREARDLLRQMVARRFQKVFGGDGGEKVDPTSIGRDLGIEQIQDKLWQLSPSRSLKKLPYVMGIRPVCHEVQRFVEVVVVRLGAQGHAAPMSLGSRMRL